ncbi:MAG TPA: segregation/condensation protein A [Micromonosporaceae bacterium]|nr:segregation/condensation protein A [Micromonosporaceae bacterium]
MTAPSVDPSTQPAPPAGAEAGPGVASTGFTVRLVNFTGPFDLLLQLISKHKLDVTEVALHRVTDEFIAYIRAMGDEWDLDEASEFLVIAATLLDLKAARLLPAATVEDEEDLALLEARDLLFARLLQYKAFKEAAAHLAGQERAASRSYPRAVALEPRYAEALPDLVLGVGPERLAQLAVKAMTPKPKPVVSIEHVHQVRVSVREHAVILRDKLVRMRTATFRALCADCRSTLEIVARFLALLELYREGLVAFEQVQALGELSVRWTGADDAVPQLDFDEYDEAPAPGSARLRALPPLDTAPPDEPLPDGASPEVSPDGAPPEVSRDGPPLEVSRDGPPLDGELPDGVPPEAAPPGTPQAGAAGPPGADRPQIDDTRPTLVGGERSPGDR